MMKFLVDAQLPPALARWIDAGEDFAVHVADLGLIAASDKQIWECAKAEGMILVTKDEDFVTMVINKQEVQLLWIRRGNCSKKELLDWFASLFKQAKDLLLSGEPLVELT